MDYEEQRAFLARQRQRWLPAALGCGLLLVAVARTKQPLSVLIAAGALALGLLWSAYYLPNYLCLTPSPRRRLRWLARARWFLLLLFGLVTIPAQAWLAVALLPLAALLHFLLERRFQTALPPDPLAARGHHAVGLPAAYALFDLVLLWAAAVGGSPGVLLVMLLLGFAFLATVPLRLGSSVAKVSLGVVIASVSYLLAPDPVTVAAVFLWVAATAHLLHRADEQNQRNYEALVRKLEAFTQQPRDQIVQLMSESTRRLAEDWNRSRPQGAAEVAAWYSRNALHYLYDIAQHHLLYTHILYTLGLLRLARGHVLDFGGGNGDFSCAAVRVGADTTYLDVPGQSADFVRWRAQQEGLPLTIIHHLDEARGPFDVIYGLDVLEHLVETKPVLARWQELLRPGGKLVLTYYVGPASSAPMHIDPGYNVRDYLLTQGFRDIKGKHAGLFSPELMQKKQFLILEKAAESQ